MISKKMELEFVKFEKKKTHTVFDFPKPVSLLFLVRTRMSYALYRIEETKLVCAIFMEISFGLKNTFGGA